MLCPNDYCRQDIFRFYNFKPNVSENTYLGLFCDNCWECFNFSVSEPVKNIFLRLESKISENADGLDDLYTDPGVYMKSPEGDNEKFIIFKNNENILIIGVDEGSIKSFNVESKIEKIFEYLKV